MIIRIGIGLSIAGLVLSTVFSIYDLIHGRTISIGDTQLVAVIQGLVMVVFGVLLVLFGMYSHAVEKVESFKKVHKDLVPGKTLGTSRFHRFIGTLTVLGGLGLTILMSLFDVLNGRSISIGKEQEAALFIGLSISLIGLVFLSVSIHHVVEAKGDMIVTLHGFRIFRADEPLLVEKGLTAADYNEGTNVREDDVKGPQDALFSPEAVTAETMQTEPVTGYQSSTGEHPVVDEAVGVADIGPEDGFEENIVPWATVTDPPYAADPGMWTEDNTGVAQEGEVSDEGMVEMEVESEVVVEPVQEEVGEPFPTAIGVEDLVQDADIAEHAEPQQGSNGVVDMGTHGSVLDDILNTISSTEEKAEVGSVVGYYDDGASTEEEVEADAIVVCPVCSKEIKQSWSSCPFCGSIID